MTAAKVILCTIALIASSASAWAFDTIARSALVLDAHSGTVLYSKEADRPLPPASMSKLMTLYMLFEALDDGRVTMDTTFIVSQKAHKMGGSKMFLRHRERVSVENLIHGIIVLSGNDACVVVAEAMEGSESEFARKMTERARKLGMKNSTFANSTGWPHPAHRMSAEDLVFLANRIITEFPEYYGFFKQDTFTWANITQENRNPLLKMDIGADGLKTGHTQEAGYGLVGSAVQGDRRIIFMLSGLDSNATRAVEGERITNWAFRNFVNTAVFEKGAVIGTAKVWLGRSETVELYSPTEINALMPYDAADNYAASIKYIGPIEAPIEKDAQVATLVLDIKDMAPAEFPLYAKETIRKGGLFSRIKTSTNILKNEVIGASLDR